MFMMHFTGVSFNKDWTAKEGECEKKCEGTAGPFLVVRECESETGFSCDGLKEPTEETKECTKHCSSTGRMKQFYIIQTNPACWKEQTKCREECHCKFLLMSFTY